MGRWWRYQLSQEKEDLDKSIVHTAEAIFLQPVSRDGPLPNNVFQLLFHLAFALIERSDEFEEHEGLKYSIEYLRYLLRFPFDYFDVPRTVMTTSLIRALGNQVILCAGNGTRDIKEMLDLGRQLLTSDLSADFSTAAFLFLTKAAAAEFQRGLPTELLDEVIECVRGAAKVCPPDSHGILLALAYLLLIRFTTTHSLDDCEEAMALFENILDPNQPGGSPDSILGDVSSHITGLKYIRWAILQTPEYSEVAISHIRAKLSSPSIDEADRFKLADLLSTLIKRRFRDYSLSESLEEANFNDSRVVALSLSQSLETSGLKTESDDVRKTYSTMLLQQKIQHLEELLSNTPPGTEPYKKCLRNLVMWYESKSHRTNITSDIKEWVKYSRL